jgi:acetyltransferase-like isoleucine patch superfamily enzyme
MSEKEKMLNGEFYISWDKDLAEERRKAKDLLFQFNHLRPALKTEGEEIIRELFGKAGDNCWIEPPFFCDYGYNITVGDNFYANTIAAF